MTIDCLESLSKTDYAPYRVVVVDNGSTDDSVASIRAAYPETVILEAGENIGYSEGNNAGIRFALENGAEYILLLNNDTSVDADMLDRLVETAEADPNIGIVGPTQYYFDLPDTIWGAANYVQWAVGDTHRSRMGETVSGHQAISTNGDLVEADYIDTCAALVHRQVFERTGLLDGRYFINYDDADIGLRACEAGFRVVYVPRASMWHKVSAAMGQASPATTYYMTRNRLLLFWKHGSGHRRVLALTRITLGTLRTIAAWTLKPKYKADGTFRRRRDANVLALRDFYLGRFGKMGPDVVRTCYGD
jgi:GT2 family glycosyltransferase